MEQVRTNDAITMAVVNLEDLQKLCEGTVQRAVESSKSDNDDTKLVTRNEASKLLSVSLPTLWRWAKAGYLVPVEVGGLRRYRMRDIRRVLGN